MKGKEHKTISVSRDGWLVEITLNRPKAFNAMNLEMVKELTETFDELGKDTSVRAVLLRGKDGNFCAGADIKDTLSALKRKDSFEGDPFYSLNRKFGELITVVNSAPQVVIVLLEGAVLGGGFGLACVSDVAIARKNAVFGMPETTLGLPPAQIIPFVAERIGLSHSRRLALTGARFGAEEACRLGLVHYICETEEDMKRKLDEVLEQVRRCAPGANAVTKELLLATKTVPREELLDIAAQKFSECITGPEGEEGLKSFLEKKKPSWSEE